MLGGHFQAVVPCFLIALPSASCDAAPWHDSLPLPVQDCSSPVEQAVTIRLGKEGGSIPSILGGRFAYDAIYWIFQNQPRLRG